MQYLNNDMDELFEKAGRNYPLKVDASNWEAVAGKLLPPENGVLLSSDVAEKKYNWLLLLMVLMLLISAALLLSVPEKKTGAVTAAKPAMNGQKNIYPGPLKMKTAAENTIIKSKQEAVRVVNSNTETREGMQAQGDNEKKIRPQQQRINVNYNYEKPAVNFSVNPASTIGPTALRKRNQGFYGGLIAGPDLSSIKYQHISQAGYGVGLIGGYRLTKRISIEAGLIYSKKKYYTDGKYFDKTKANIPPNIYIEDLDGGCEMLEIPLNIRYNFTTGPKKLFATAGASSYFMLKEDYSYSAYAGGNYYEGYRKYNGSGNHLFSNAQFSIGYEYGLSKKISLRAEPYIKIPISKIGIGNLPVTSAGIYFGIIKQIR